MKKLLCFVLSSLMLISAASCASPNDKTSDTTNNSSHATAEDTLPVSEAETEDPSYICDIPEDLDYDGDTVVVLYDDVTGRRDEMNPAEEGGVVSDAVHARNIAVEEDLGVKLDMVTLGNIVGALKSDFKAGTETYDLITCSTKASIIPAMEGYYLDLNRLEYIDTSKSYWTKGYNDMVTFTDANMQFLASGPMALSMFRYMFLTIYNKQLFEDYRVDDPYEVIKQGKWTLDYQYSIMNGKYVEMDADNKRGEADFYGFVTGDTISVDPYMVAADVHLIIKDPATGMLQYTTEATQRLSDLCDKVQKIYSDSGTYKYSGAGYDDVQKTYIIKHFIDERAMMATTLFLQLELNIDELTNLTYGIAPIPKFDEAQENYGSYVQDQVSSFGISGAISSIDRRNELAAVLEAIAYHSYLLVRPAYYDTALTERYMQDPQSSEVLDLMFDSLSFDFASSCCNIFVNCVIRDNLRPLLSGTHNTIGSSTRSWVNTVNRVLQRQYNPILEELKPD